MLIPRRCFAIALGPLALVVVLNTGSHAFAAAPEIVSVVKIWDKGPHNAFTDLTRWRGQWYCTFREADAHVGGDGKLRVLASADGTDWEPVGLIAEDGIDLRDPKLSVTPDDRLMIVAGGSAYRGGKTLLGRQTRVIFSKDGRQWTPPLRVLAEGDWLWRVTWHDGRAYGVAYNGEARKGKEAQEAAKSSAPVGTDPADWKLKLVVSEDGVKYDVITYLGVPGFANETTLRFLPDGELLALVRREGGNTFGWIGHSKAPYKDWQWHETRHRLGGPNFCPLPDGSVWAASRSHSGETKTVLGRMERDAYEPVLTLPSGGDTSYAGLVWHDGLLWISYYSSHEGKSSIYLAKVRVPQKPVASEPASERRAAYPAPVTGQHVLRDFRFGTGDTLPEVRMHYRTIGQPRRDAQGNTTNAVLILHGTTGDSENFLRPEFAGELFGPGQPLDSSQYYLIIPDNLGHGRSSKPSDGLRARFPRYGYGDMVKAQHQLLTEGLQVTHARLVMGTSMGGMHTWLWGEEYPEFMDALLPLASLPTEIAGRNRIWRKLVSDAIRSDPEWLEGEYKTQPRSLRLVGEMFMFMSGNPILRQKEGPTRSETDRRLEEYAARFVRTKDANDVLYAIESSRDYDPAPGLDKIRAPLLAINFADDLINPPELGILEQAIQRVKHGKALVIPQSDRTQGHGTHTLAAVWKAHLEELLKRSRRWQPLPARPNLASTQEVNTGPWKLADLRTAPKVTVERQDRGVSLVYYENGTYRGKQARVFGYLARPEKAEGKLPAMVLVHGGGGTAFKEWAELWAKRGYVALAMDLAGHGPDRKRLTDGGPDQDDKGKFAAEQITDFWTYHAVAAVIRGVSLLANQPDVDPERIGITGISWGGYLTCIVAGLDDRLKVAVPVYGCGHIHENSAWLPIFNRMTAEKRREWIENFEPSRYLAQAKMPVLFVNGTNDFAYPLDSYRKSYELVKHRTLCVTVNMPHGHPQGWAPVEIGLFVDQHLRGGQPLARFKGIKRSGRQVEVAFSAERPIKTAHLHFTTETGNWQQRKWQTLPAMIDGSTIRAELPEARPLVYFVTLTDDRKATVSTRHEVLD